MAARKRVRGKLSGMKSDGLPNAYWRRFKERLDNYDQIPVSEWKEENFLGHILKRYKDFMGFEFTLSYSGPPSKCKEIFCIRRMLLALSMDEDPESIKKYIDWVFDTVIIPQKVTITSIAYFFTINFILHFKQSLRKQKVIDRTTVLPQTYIDIALKFDMELSTYGDLALAKVAIDQGMDPDNLYFNIINEIKQAGFDDSILNSI